jgi:transposase
MFNYKDYAVYLACGKTDMRKSINGLYEIVEYNFNISPFDKSIFVFCNHQRNRVKMLVWEDNGFWVHFKRLEKGHITWPEETDGEIKMNIDIGDFENLLKSPGIKCKIKRQEVLKKY